MKYEIVWEYITHWALCLVIIGFCGAFMPALLIVTGAGYFFVDYLGLAFFGLGDVEAKIAYGAITFLAFTVVTKAWMIRGCIDEWTTFTRMHQTSLDRMKYGQAYFRNRSTH